MIIIGWILWVLLAFIAFSLSLGCWTYIKQGRRVQRATVMQAILFVLLAIIFIVFDWNKIHIVWAAPLIFFLTQAL